MKTIKGPAIFLAQFVGDDPPFNTLNNIAKWAADLGFKGVQIPTWDSRLFDLEKAANSQSYCTEILETLDNHGFGDYRVVNAHPGATGSSSSCI